MTTMSARQRTLRQELVFDGFGVHNALPSTLIIGPAPVNSGYLIQRRLDGGGMVGPVVLSAGRVSRTTLCTTVDLGDSVSIATVEHVVSALSGLGVDNALLTVTGAECPILDGSAAPFVRAILKSGFELQPRPRRYVKVLRQVLVRSNDASAALEPYNGRRFDIEIDFASKVIGRQRMIFDCTPKKYAEDVASARTFGFVNDAKVLRQAGFALGSSMENSIALHEDKILNPGGLRYEDEFVRHKLLDAIGDLGLSGSPIYGRFRSKRGGHGLNAMVLQGLFASRDNYEFVYADDLPLDHVALDELPEGTPMRTHLRAVT